MRQNVCLNHSPPTVSNASIYFSKLITLIKDLKLNKILRSLNQILVNKLLRSSISVLTRGLK